MAKKVKLVGCARYNSNGSLYMEGEVTIVSDEEAHRLLNAADDYTGYPYFEEVTGDVAAKAPSTGDEEELKVAPRAERKPGRPRKAVAAPSPAKDAGAEGIIEV